jgi:hypothetical protein
LDKYLRRISFVLVIHPHLLLFAIDSANPAI